MPSLGGHRLGLAVARLWALADWRPNLSPSGRPADPNGRGQRAEQSELGLGSEDERRKRRDKILEEHRETIKCLGE